MEAKLKTHREQNAEAQPRQWRMLPCGTVIHYPLNGIDLNIPNSADSQDMQQEATIDAFPETAKLMSLALATI